MAQNQWKTDPGTNRCMVIFTLRDSLARSSSHGQLQRTYLVDKKAELCVGLLWGLQLLLDQAADMHLEFLQRY